MVSIVVCPACGGRVRVADSATPGSVARCPYCSEAFSIRSGASSRPVRARPARGALRLGPLGPPRRRKQDRTALYVVAGVSGGLVLLLTVALIVALSRGHRQMPSDSEKTATAAGATTEVEGRTLEWQPAAEIAEPDSAETLQTEGQAGWVSAAADRGFADQATPVGVAPDSTLPPAPMQRYATASGGGRGRKER